MIDSIIRWRKTVLINPERDYFKIERSLDLKEWFLVVEYALSVNG